MLNAEQIARFRTDGFLVVEDVFSPAEVAAYRAAAESGRIREINANRKHTEVHVHQLEVTCKDPLFRDLAADARLTDKLAPLIGEDLQVQHSKLATQPLKKDVGGFGWHQDFAFFPHTNTDLAAIFVYLDDTDTENGCMSMVRGSHKLGLLEHRVDGYFSGKCQEEQAWSDASKVVPVRVRAGGISIHHCLTLHGSGPNKSGLPRRGVVYQYRNADAYQLADHIWQDTGFQVRGRFSETVRCEAGRIYIAKRKAWDPPFGNLYLQIGEQAQRWNAERQGAGCRTPASEQVAAVTG
ncbi:MAG: phytanoyl-CoA dioxygenase family protein [Planctomycetota bacterium]|nr:phytanoyl-CoA dioxygenase family protein [Planctomycetota bacterium]